MYKLAQMSFFFSLLKVKILLHVGLFLRAFYPPLRTICLLSRTGGKPVLTTVEEEFAPLTVSAVKMPFYANALSVW